MSDLMSQNAWVLSTALKASYKVVACLVFLGVASAVDNDETTTLAGLGSVALFGIVGVDVVVDAGVALVQRFT